MRKMRAVKMMRMKQAVTTSYHCLIFTTHFTNKELADQKLTFFYLLVTEKSIVSFGIILSQALQLHFTENMSITLKIFCQ